MSNLSACDTFFNFQLYTNVHTVVEVYTATGIEQYCVAMQEGDGWLMMYELDAPVYCESFGDVVDAAWWAMVDHLGMSEVNAIDRTWQDIAA